MTTPMASTAVAAEQKDGRLIGRSLPICAKIMTQWLGWFWALPAVLAGFFSTIKDSHGKASSFANYALGINQPARKLGKLCPNWDAMGDLLNP